MDNALNIAAKTRKIDVDNRLSLRFYYRTAANILRQVGYVCVDDVQEDVVRPSPGCILLLLHGVFNCCCGELASVESTLWQFCGQFVRRQCHMCVGNTRSL